MTSTDSPRPPRPHRHGRPALPTLAPRIEIIGALGARYDEILTPEALAFLAELHDRFAGTPRTSCSPTACDRASTIAQRARPATSCAETAHIRDDTDVAGRRRRARAWRTAASRSPDRPTAKMTINALNSGAKVWLADQEDATSPTWTNVIEGQLDLHDAIRGDLEFTSPEGKDVPGHRRARPRRS